MRATSTPRPARHDAWIGRARTGLLAACLLLIVAGANWAVFARYGSDLPYWDQWDAEGLHTLVPWFGHDGFVSHLFQPHNEHRVVLTKLQNLAAVLVAGQWDARVECLFNALLHGAIAAGLWMTIRRWVTRVGSAACYVLSAALFALPFSTDNLLLGFDSQQYWLVALALAALALVPFARPWTHAWCLGVSAAVLALGSMASGFIAAVVVLAVLIWKYLLRQLAVRDAVPSLLAMCAVVAVGWFTRGEVPQHASLKAAGASEFALSFLRSLEWPLRGADWAGFLIWLPWSIVAAIAVLGGIDRTRRREVSQAELCMVALGAWVLLQIAATAYARGAGAEYPPSRYLDTLIFGVAVNAFAVVWLLFSAPVRHKTPLRFVGILATALAWTTATVLGVAGSLQLNRTWGLPAFRECGAAGEDHLRAYLTNNDLAELVAPIPYPSAPALAVRLSNLALRSRMPASVRQGLPVIAASDSAAFLESRVSQRDLDKAPRIGVPPSTVPLGARTVWGSFGPGGAAGRGTWRSRPIPAPLHGWLVFQTTGGLGHEGLRLDLCDGETGAVLGTVIPRSVPNKGWQAAYVRAPEKPFVLMARDESLDGWFAFSAPVEMSSASYGALRLMENGLLVSGIAAGIALLLALSALGRPPVVRSAAPLAHACH